VSDDSLNLEEEGTKGEKKSNLETGGGGRDETFSVCDGCIGTESGKEKGFIQKGTRKKKIQRRPFPVED